MQAPLSGIRVLDLSSYIAAPYGCSLLADLGAQVIKVEPPGGDTLRHYPSSLQQESRAFLGINRSKHAITIDAKCAKSAPILQRLVARTDVLVHNFRPSVPQRLGLDYDEVKKLQPTIIYCSLTGYGERGPLKHKAGYDQVLQAMTGICTSQGEANGRPEIVYGSVVDYYAASLLAYGVTAALYHRERAGEGQHVKISLLGAALAMQSARFVWADNEPRDASRDLRSGGVTGIHPTKSGEIYLSANTPHFWRALCELLNLPQLAVNPAYTSVRKRAQHANQIVPVIRKALMAHSALEWEEIFGEQVPCSALRKIEDMFDHPQVLAQRLVQTFEHPTVGRYRGMANPIQFSANMQSEAFAAPAIGQHTDEILVELGFSKTEIEELRRAGVVTPAPPGSDQGSV